MRLHLILIVAMGLCLLICKPVFSQDKETAIDKVLNFPPSFFTKVNHNTTKLEERLTKQTEKYLQRADAIVMGFFELPAGAENTAGEIQGGV